MIAGQTFPSSPVTGFDRKMPVLPIRKRLRQYTTPYSEPVGLKVAEETAQGAQ